MYSLTKFNYFLTRNIAQVSSMIEFLAIFLDHCSDVSIRIISFFIHELQTDWNKFRIPSFIQFIQHSSHRHFLFESAELSDRICDLNATILVRVLCIIHFDI